MKPTCPIQGCQLVVKRHSDRDDDVIVFSCPKHGRRMRIMRNAATPDQIARLEPDQDIIRGPYYPLVAVEVLQEWIEAGGRNFKYLRPALQDIADRFVREFYDSRLSYAWGNVRKSVVLDAWHEWFSGHYYERYITDNRFGRTLKDIGCRDDQPQKYWIDLRIKPTM